MLFNIMRHAAVGVALTVMSAPPPAFAAATDYKFEVVTAQPAGPQKTDVTVRLVHLADKKPVADAVSRPCADVGCVFIASEGRPKSRAHELTRQPR